MHVDSTVCHVVACGSTGREDNAHIELKNMHNFYGLKGSVCTLSLKKYTSLHRESTFMYLGAFGHLHDCVIVLGA